MCVCTFTYPDLYLHHVTMMTYPDRYSGGLSAEHSLAHTHLYVYLCIYPYLSIRGLGPRELNGHRQRRERNLALPECVRAVNPNISIATVKGVLNQQVAQASAVATRSQPPKPASLRDAKFAAPCGAGKWLLAHPRVAL